MHTLPLFFIYLTIVLICYRKSKTKNYEIQTKKKNEQIKT